MGTVRFLADGTTPTISKPEIANPDERSFQSKGIRFFLERHSAPRGVNCHALSQGMDS
jgi:hypothetical protein